MSERRDFGVAAVLLCLALAVGGAGSSFPRLELLLELAGVATLLYFIMTRRPWRLAPLSRFALAILALVLLLPLVQLIPLPPALWTHLPGREIAVQVSNLAGFAGKWRPLSLDPEGTIRSVIVLIPAAGILVATLFLPTADRLRLVWIVLGFALISAALGAAQFATGGGMTPYPSTHQGYAIGLFVNRNHQATLLLLAIPLAAALGAGRAARLRQPMSATLLTIAAVAVLALTVLATTSRMGLALIPVAVACGLFLFFRGRANWRLAAPALLGAGVVGVGMLVSGMFGRTLARFSSLDDARLDYWRDIDWAFQHYGYAGTGFGTFVPLYQSAESLDLVSSNILNHAHNDYLEIALEGGWPALVLLAAFLAFLVLAVRRLMVAPSSLDRRLMSLAALTGILVIMIFSVVDYPLRMPAISTTFALLCALLLPTAGDDRANRPRPVDGQARRTRKRRRQLAQLAAAGVGVAAIWIAIAAGVSSADLMGRRTDAAIRWAPWSADAYASRATTALGENSLQSAANDARAAIARSPMNQSAVRTLGIAEVASGSDDRAYKLMGIAAVLGWRDFLTQLWVMDAAIRSGEGAKAVQRCEALLRQNRMTVPAYRLIIQSATNPTVLAALSDMLSRNPSWRNLFLASADRLEPQQFNQFEGLLGALAGTSAPPSIDEVKPFARRVGASGERDRLPRILGVLRQANLLSNGEFQQSRPEKGRLTPRSWVVAGSSDLVIGIGLPSQPRQGNALRIHSPRPVAKMLSQSLMLQPGRYTLTFWVDGAGQPAGLPLQWELQCQRGGAARPIATTERAASAGQWRRMEGEFAVPVQDCAKQELRLRWTSAATHVSPIWLDGVELRQRGHT